MDRLIVCCGLTFAALNASFAKAEGAVLQEVGEQRAVVSATGLVVALDCAKKGAVACLRSPAGVAFEGMSRPLFSVEIYPDDNVQTNFLISAADAGRFECCPGPDGVKMVWRDFPFGLVEAEASVYAKPGDDCVRWRLALQTKEGWSVYRSKFPQITLAAKIGSSSEDDSLILGRATGGIIRSPRGSERTLRTLWWHRYRYAQDLAVQFFAYWDRSALFYCAAEDAGGHDKEVWLRETDDDFEFWWQAVSPEPDEKRVWRQEYDVVTRAFDARELPCDWYDAADRYRDWALRQPMCAKRIRERDDLPSWFKDAPGMVRMDRAWIERPQAIRDWITRRWRTRLAGIPLIVSMWGWEKWGYWAAPDYFPVCGGDKAFVELTTFLRTNGAHSFLWPSGYSWLYNFQKREDGSFLYSLSEEAVQAVRPHLVCTRYGKPYSHDPYWMNGGSGTFVCGAEKWGRDWLVREIGEPLAERGCDIVQLDQVHGLQECWSLTHGHRVGGGTWRCAALDEQFEALRRAMKAKGSDAIICMEGPCEYFVGRFGIQDIRDCQSDFDEWACPFNYVYHEYIPTFQSNFVQGDRTWAAHCCAEGQMPYYRPSFSETNSCHAESAFMDAWMNLYHGSGREFLAFGRRVRPPRVICKTYEKTIKRRRYKDMVTRKFPCVVASAFEAEDGRRVAVLVNATDQPQHAELLDGCKCTPLVLGVDEIKLVPLAYVVPGGARSR